MLGLDIPAAYHIHPIDAGQYLRRIPARLFSAKFKARNRHYPRARSVAGRYERHTGDHRRRRHALKIELAPSDASAQKLRTHSNYREYVEQVVVRRDQNPHVRRRLWDDRLDGVPQRDNRVCCRRLDEHVHELAERLLRAVERVVPRQRVDSVRDERRGQTRRRSCDEERGADEVVQCVDRGLRRGVQVIDQGDDNSRRIDRWSARQYLLHDKFGKSYKSR